MVTDGAMLFFFGFQSFDKGRDNLIAAEKVANTIENRIKHNPVIYIKTGLFYRVGATANGAGEIQISLKMQ